MSRFVIYYFITIVYFTVYNFVIFFIFRFIGVVVLIIHVIK